MRPVLLAGLLLLAGCVTPANVAPPGSSGPALASYALDCDVARGNASWTESCLAFASPNDSPSKTEIDLGVNPADPMNVVVSSKDVDPKASQCVWAVPQVTKDGGKSWTTVYIGGEQSARRPGEPLWGWECITDPIMAFDAEGTLYYSLQAYDHSLEAGGLPGVPIVGGVAAVGSAIFAARSTDGGLSWDKIVTLHVGDGANVFHDYMRVLVNPKTGTYHTIWNQFTGPAAVVPVLVSWDGSSDRANPPVYIPIPDAPQGGTMAGFAAATDGTLYVLIEVGDDAYFSKSADDGQSFSTPVRVPQHEAKRIERQALGAEAFRTTGSYELIVDNSGGPRDGWLYATISGCESKLECDVFLSRSEDGGASWSEPVLVNGGEHKPGLQWIPRPIVDRLGNLHMVYFDSSRAPEGGFIDASWAVSTDGGESFENAYLTSAPFDGNLGIHQDGFPFIGDYNGIGSAGDWVYMAFPTTVTGRAEIAVAKARLPAP